MLLTIEMTIKLADLGLAKILRDKNELDYLETLLYVSPEVYEGKRYNTNTDIWYDITFNV